MPAILLSLRNVWKKVVLLCAVGVALSFIRKLIFGSAQGAFLSDMLFTAGSVFLCFGLGGLVKNMGMFNSLKYGTKCLINMLRNKRQEPADKMKGGYLEYVKSRPKSRDVPWMMGFAAVFLILSALAALPMLS